MKYLIFIFFFIFLISCDDDINDSKYRNSNYTFYKKNGEKGVWQKISNDSDFDYKPGLITYFFDDGNIFATIKIVDSFPNRIVNYYNENKILATEYYTNNALSKTIKKDGYHIEYRSNKGDIISEGFIKNNEEQGEWKDYYENGSLERIINFKNGKKHGSFKELYENGMVRALGKMWNGRRSDTIKWFYESGKIKCIEITLLDTTSKISHAISKHYNENGNLSKLINIKNEKREGIAFTFYDNGKVKSKLNYSNDILEGDGFGYYESGELYYFGKTKNDYLIDNLNYYDKKGKLLKTYKYDEYGVFIDSIVY